MNASTSSRTESAEKAIAGEVKPCPFCGNQPRIVDAYESSRSIEGETEDEEWLSFIECDCVDMFFVKGSASSQTDARRLVIAAWNRREPARSKPSVEHHVNGEAYRKISVEQWRQLGGDSNKFCDWHEGIGYVVYDAQALEEYLAKTKAPSVTTSEGGL